MLLISIYSMLSLSNLILSLLDAMSGQHNLIASVSFLVINFILLIWEILKLPSNKILSLKEISQSFIILLRISKIVWSFGRLIGFEKPYLNCVIIMFFGLEEINLLRLYDGTDNQINQTFESLFVIKSLSKLMQSAILKSIFKELKQYLINLKLRVKLRLIRTYYSVNGRRLEDYAYSDQYLDDIFRVRRINSSDVY